MINCVKGHAGYYSCDRHILCIQAGEIINGRISLHTRSDMFVEWVYIKGYIISIVIIFP